MQRMLLLLTWGPAFPATAGGCTQACYIPLKAMQKAGMTKDWLGCVFMAGEVVSMLRR
jgi:hypothetical protein